MPKQDMTLDSWSMYIPTNTICMAIDEYNCFKLYIVLSKYININKYIHAIIGVVLQITNNHNGTDETTICGGHGQQNVEIWSNLAQIEFKSHSHSDFFGFELSWIFVSIPTKSPDGQSSSTEGSIENVTNCSQNVVSLWIIFILSFQCCLFIL